MLTWTTDDRPPHPWTRLYVQGMRLRRDDRAFEGAARTRRTALARQRDGDAPPTLATRLAARVEEREVAGLRTWVVRPRGVQPVGRVAYVHGGGYVHPLTPDYWRLVRALVRVPAEVVVPAYPLAPRTTVDEALPRLLEVVRRGGDPALPTVVMGDSAGGALALVLARRWVDEAADRGRAPVGVVPLSPWLDAELADEEVRDLEPTDPVLSESGLRAAGRWWAGERRDPDDPLVSPVRLPLDGLPPVDLWIGDRDVLRPAVDHLADRARDADVALHVHDVSSMFHVWMTRAVPEGRRTRRALVRLVRHRVARTARRTA